MTRRRLERRVADLEDSADDYPDLTLAELLSSDDLEGAPADAHRKLIRVDGQIYDGTDVLETLMDQLEGFGE